MPWSLRGARRSRGASAPAWGECGPGFMRRWQESGTARRAVPTWVHERRRKRREGHYTFSGSLLRGRRPRGMSRLLHHGDGPAYLQRQELGFEVVTRGRYGFPRWAARCLMSASVLTTSGCIRMMSSLRSALRVRLLKRAVCRCTGILLRYGMSLLDSFTSCGDQAAEHDGRVVRR